MVYASRDEARIETPTGHPFGLVAESPPARRRGSKPRGRNPRHPKRIGSPPARRRGSKPDRRAPPQGVPGRLLRGGVERNIGARMAVYGNCRPPLRGGVDRTADLAKLEGVALQLSPPGVGGW